MPTTKQRQALKNVMENHGNVSKAMREAGYSKATAKNPKNLTESNAYRELMVDLGLTDELLIGALVSDIKSKPKQRTKELELGFRLLGRLKEVGTPAQVNVIQLILKKWGLDDVGQDPGDASGVSKD